MGFKSSYHITELWDLLLLLLSVWKYPRLEGVVRVKCEHSWNFSSTGENPYKVDSEQIKQRAKLLQKYLKDEQKELQALYALQALMLQMEQPASK